MRDKRRFLGCLLGGAVGDALGYAVEFKREPQIFAQYGPGGITRYDLKQGKALISDDTQMTMFTAVGLLYGETHSRKPGTREAFRDAIRLAYLDWYKTQTKLLPSRDERPHAAWLANFEEFYHQRAPGNTCMLALGKDGCGTIETPVNNSKGCGGVMRVAPIGLYFCDKEGCDVEADLLGAEAAAITHGHALGYLPAAALVHIVRTLASGKYSEIRFAVEDAADSLRALFPEASELKYLLSLMQRAIALSEKNMSDLEAIHELGKGWVAEETLAIALYCALKYPHDFEKAIVASVNHKGDSDSTGAVTGNILGAYLGVDAIPDYYLEKLEMRDIIEEVAEDLYHGCRMEASGEASDPVWSSKYVHVDFNREIRAKE